MADRFPARQVPKILRQQVSSAPEMMAESEQNEWKLIHIMVAIVKDKHVMEDVMSGETFNVTFSGQCLANRRRLQCKPNHDGYCSVSDMPSLTPKNNDRVTLTGVRKGAGLKVNEWHLCKQAEQDLWIHYKTMKKR